MDTLSFFSSNQSYQLLNYYKEGLRKQSRQYLVVLIKKFVTTKNQLS